jgi:hypothetical protein
MKIEYVPNTQRVSDYAGTLEGWRLWIAARHEIKYFDGARDARKKLRGPYLLRSVTAEDMWRPKQPMVADCNISLGYRFDLTHGDEDHACPDSECKCGIYAVGSLKKLMEMYDGVSRAYFRFDMERHIAVVGKVKLWGKVIPAQWGWRAQYGYPSNLYIVDTFMGRIRNRSARVKEDLKQYGVPVEYMSTQDLMGYTTIKGSKTPPEVHLDDGEDKVIDLNAVEP